MGRLQSGNVLQLHADVELFVEAGHLVFFREATEQCVHRLHLHSLEYVLFCRVSQRRRSELLRVQLSVALSISHASIALSISHASHASLTLAFSGRSLRQVCILGW